MVSLLHGSKENISCFFPILAPNVAPSEVGGGGGRNRELTITWMVGIVMEQHLLYLML